MKGDAPTVMVSSTFYDLREIRQQLAAFIERDLGYRALISEDGGFPVDPSVSAIENCRQRVEENADVLVLVIGGRYGSVDAGSGRSITNLEYLAARAKGIPVYAFLETRTLVLYEAWQSADTVVRASLGATVDTGELFDFIDQVRKADGVWMFGFDRSEDIVDVLRGQLAYQAHAGLLLMRAVRRSADHNLLSTLSGVPFKLALEKPAAWEYRLFAHTLRHEILAAQALRREYDLGISFGAKERVDLLQFAPWAQARMGEISHLVEVADKLMNTALQDAFGPPGIAGSAEGIIFVARSLARVYREGIEWALRVRRTHAEAEGFDLAIAALAACSPSIVEKIGDWGLALAGEIDRTVEEAYAAPAGGERRTVHFTLHFESVGIDNFIALMRQAFAHHGIFGD